MKLIKTIDHIVRVVGSASGNPRFRVHFTDGSSALTERDGAVNSGIENPEFKNVPVNVQFDNLGYITYMVPVKD